MQLKPFVFAVVMLVLASHVTIAADGKMSGVVALNGEPLEGAKIIFHWKGQFLGTKTQRDGRFAIDQIQSGSYKVTFEGKNVPAKYATEEQSELRVEIKPGENTIDFDLRK